MDPCISVFGSGTAPEGSPVYQDAYKIGLILGKAGFTHVSGGYKGTMEAGAKGAREAGGKTIGVTITEWGPPNPFITQNIATSHLFERIQRLMELAHGYIVLPGAAGTLIELSMAWERNQKRIDKVKPIVLLGDYWIPVIDVVKTQYKEHFTDNRGDSRHVFGGYLWKVQTPEETLSCIMGSDSNGANLRGFVNMVGLE